MRSSGRPTPGLQTSGSRLAYFNLVHRTGFVNLKANDRSTVKSNAHQRVPIAAGAAAPPRRTAAVPAEPSNPPSATIARAGGNQSGRLRLDQALVARGICPSREKAQRAILAGQVRINQQRARKPSDWIRSSDHLELKEPERFVSRGGYKLEHALVTFGLSVVGWSAADLGASTGGFTDCLLQRGAAKVFAVDVGHGQLAWKLRQDPRVVVLDRMNARNLTLAHMPPPAAPLDLVVMDCSFISLRQILPAASLLLRNGGQIVALVKPQFEAGKKEADRGAGVITDPAVHARVLAELQEFVTRRAELRWTAQTESPLLGPAGNKEFLVHLEKIN